MKTREDVLEDIRQEKKIAEGRMIGGFLNQLDLIADYSINVNKLTDVSRFYFNLIDELYVNGYKNVDKVSVMAYLKDKQPLLDTFNEYGGYSVLTTLEAAGSVENMDAVVQELEKYIMLEELSERHFRIEDIYHDKLKHMRSASDIAAWYDYQVDDASLNIMHSDIDFQSFEVVEDDIEKLRQGAMIGIRYNNVAPLMDYATLGFPRGEFTILGSYINHGKTSFAAYLMFAMAKKGQKIGIVANEQDLLTYKQLLIMYVLTNDLQYTGMKRKEFKMGAWNAEDEKYIYEAMDIIKEQYAPNLSFLEVFDYDTNVVSRAVRRWSKMGFELVIYDTLKADFTTPDGWIALIKSTRNLYQLASKEGIAIVGVMQLAMATMGTRRLTLDVLANGKQSSEVASEVVFFRNLFHDEMPGEKNEAQVYRYKKDKDGKFIEVKELVELDPSVPLEDYKVFFICKTRNDRVGTSFLFKFNGDLNIWEEVGYVDIVDDSLAR